MILEQKNMETKIEELSGHLGVKMKWTSSADFDLSALILEKDGSDHMVYFGSKGSLGQFPYLLLDKDAGVGDAGGDNEENLTIAKISEDIDKIFLVAWDYGAVRNGSHARFDESDIKLFLDDGGEVRHEVHLHTGDMGNCIVIATIENGPDGLKLINSSKVGTLKGLNDSKDILAIAMA